MTVSLSGDRPDVRNKSSEKQIMIYIIQRHCEERIIEQSLHGSPWNTHEMDQDERFKLL